MRPPLPLPPEDDATRVPGILLVRTDADDDTWNAVLGLMGELPGMHPPDHAAAADAPAGTSIPRRLTVGEDPAWGGADRATSEEVVAALDRPGTWVPDLVVLTDRRTARDADWLPLLAFNGSDGEAFWITPRQLAMTYLVLHLGQSSSFDQFAEDAPAEWEDEEELEPEDEDGCEPAGFLLESLDVPPRYTTPAHELQVLVQDTDLLVRTDFTDDAAWTSLVERVRHGRGSRADVIDDFGPWVTFVDDPAFAGATPEQVMAQVKPGVDPEGMTSPVVLIADAATLREPGQRVRVVPMEDYAGYSFRLAAEEVGIMVVNLALGNQDVSDWRQRDDG